MGEQRTFAAVAWSPKGKVTRRERFLAEMDAVIPWARLHHLIARHYPKAGRGRQPLCSVPSVFVQLTPLIAPGTRSA